MTTHLGGPAAQISVSKVAHGLMTMTWTSKPVSDEQAFEAIKASLDALPVGTKRILNSGEFYASDLGTANLELVSRFFEKYPEYTDRAFLSVKGAINQKALRPDSSPENLRQSVDNILDKLRGKKKLDLYEPARVDHSQPLEQTIGVLAELSKEGKFDYIGLSECSADTLRRANAIHPIAAVEIEVSPESYEDETKKVIATAKELAVVVLGYSPLGRGMLTGVMKKPEDAPEQLRKAFPRFQDEAFKHNLALVEALTAVATRKSVTPAQLCIAWVAALGHHVIPLPGSSHVKRTLENTAAGDVKLSEADLEEINKVIAGHEVKGTRYPEAGMSHLWG